MRLSTLLTLTIAAVAAPAFSVPLGPVYIRSVVPFLSKIPTRDVSGALHVTPIEAREYEQSGAIYLR